MHVGVDGTCWANGRGYGRFTREICTAMVQNAPDDSFQFFVDERAAAEFRLEAPNVELTVVELGESPTEAASAGGNRSPMDMLRLTRAVWREKPGVFFSPSVYTYFPLPPGLPAVVTVHDTIAERYPELTLPSKKARLFWKWKVKLALMQAKRILTVSNFSAREIHEVLGVPEDEIRVAVEAPSLDYHPSEDPGQIDKVALRLGLPPDAHWFVYVGGFNPHKNVDLLVRAHAELQRGEQHSTHLMLVGTIDKDVFHGDQAGIRTVIKECGTENLVHWTGFVSDEDLRHLHSGALALVLPSECEGFGLPAVEAAACGAPVIATTESPLPELLDGGGVFVQPGDLEALRDAMRLMMVDRGARERFAIGALEAARALSWDTGARAALDALREAAS